MILHLYFRFYFIPEEVVYFIGIIQNILSFDT